MLSASVARGARALAQVKLAEGDDETVCRLIVEKLADLPSVSYADIAQTAHRVGRVQLATKVRSASAATVIGV